MKELYDSKLEYAIEELGIFEHSGNQKVQFSYLGAFDQNNLLLINQYIEFAQTISFSGRRTNLFKIFVELAQNISQNSTLKKTVNGTKIGCGKLIIKEFDDYFIMESFNPATANDVELLKNREEEINSREFEDLRKLKRELIRSSRKNSQNGNIGLVSVALLSKNKIRVKVKEIEKGSYFVAITAKFNK